MTKVELFKKEVDRMIHGYPVQPGQFGYAMGIPDEGVQLRIMISAMDSKKNRTVRIDHARYGNDDLTLEERQELQAYILEQLRVIVVNIG